MKKGNEKKTLQINFKEIAPDEFPMAGGEVVQVDAVEELAPIGEPPEDELIFDDLVGQRDRGWIFFLIFYRLLQFAIPIAIVFLVLKIWRTIKVVKFDMPQLSWSYRAIGIVVVAAILGSISRAVGLKKFIPAFLVAAAAVFVAVVVVKGAAAVVTSSTLGVLFVAAVGIVFVAMFVRTISKAPTGDKQKTGGGIVANIIIDAAGHAGDIFANIFVKK